MIKNDKLENYLFIRHKLFRINGGISTIQPKQLIAWTKTVLEQDFGKGALNEIKTIKDPKLLSPELKDLYISYLENKVYNWSKLI